MDEFPGEILVYIFSYALEHYPIIINICKKWKIFMNVAIKSNNYKIRKNKDCKKLANLSIKNNTQIYQWLCINNLLYDYPLLYSKALECGNYCASNLIINYVNLITYPLMQKTILNGGVRELRLAYDRYFGDKNILFKFAAMKGIIHAVNFFINYARCEPTKQICREIIKNRQFILLKWWLQKGHPSFKRTYEAAIEMQIIDKSTKWQKRQRR